MVRAADDRWYVQSGDGAAVGPVSTDLVVRGIAARKIPAAARVCAVNDRSWLPLVAVPEFAVAVRGAAPPPPLPIPPPPSQTSEEAWYVGNDGTDVAGPIPESTVIAGILAERVRRTWRVCGVGANEWLPIESVPQFAIAFGEAGASEHRADEWDEDATVALLDPDEEAVDRGVFQMAGEVLQPIASARGDFPIREEHSRPVVADMAAERPYRGSGEQIADGLLEDRRAAHPLLALDDVHNKLVAFLQSKVETPDDAISLVEIDGLWLRYLPLCEFTGSFQADWTASAGYDREEVYTEYVEEWDQELRRNRTVPKTRTRIVTDWHPVSGRVSGTFADVIPLVAEREFDVSDDCEAIDANVLALEPAWSIDVPHALFVPPTIAPELAYKSRVKGRVNQRIDRAVERAIPGNRARDVNWTGSNDKEWREFFYPFWFGTYWYRDQCFRVRVDAGRRDARVEGGTPSDPTRDGLEPLLQHAQFVLRMWRKRAVWFAIIAVVGYYAQGLVRSFLDMIPNARTIDEYHEWLWSGSLIYGLGLFLGTTICFACLTVGAGYYEHREQALRRASGEGKRAALDRFRRTLGRLRGFPSSAEPFGRPWRRNPAESASASQANGPRVLYEWWALLSIVGSAFVGFLVAVFGI